MSPLTAQDLVQRMSWRYATKKFDPTRKIDVETWEALEQSLVLAPSSYGLQPWKFLVIQDPALKKELRAVSWNQAQVEDCSHQVVFLKRSPLGMADLERFLARTAEVRGVSMESLGGYRGFMVKDLVEGPRSQAIDTWASNQVYIALGTFMTAAAMLGVDTCPLEGLDSKAYDRILGLEGSGYQTACACPAGFRHPDDKYATLPKVRYAAAELIEHR